MLRAYLLRAMRYVYCVFVVRLKKEKGIWATLLLDRLLDFAVAPFSAGGNSSSEHQPQSTGGRSSLSRCYYSHVLCTRRI